MKRRFAPVIAVAAVVVLLAGIGLWQKGRSDAAAADAAAQRLAVDHQRKMAAAKALLDKSNEQMIADAAEAARKKVEDQRAVELAAKKWVEEQNRKAEPVLIAQCKDLITSALHDPASAEWLDKGVLFPYGGDTLIQFKVRARNAYNAARLTTATCTVHDGMMTVSSK